MVYVPVQEEKEKRRSRRSGLCARPRGKKRRGGHVEVVYVPVQEEKEKRRSSRRSLCALPGVEREEEIT
ncbi:hypothetical protein AB1K84_12440 [Mesobacillus foraminis]|uniref:hypothetical protein n=1 Tax=Mesobacillus foraminis TaxID=279826 RepID=UPI0039A0286C